MSYLTLEADVNNLKLAVISFWFRVPEESADGARAATADDFYLYKNLHGVIPLITWGPQPMAKTGEVIPIYQGGVTVGGGPITLEVLDLSGPPVPMGSSYIGLFVGTKDDPRDPTLDVNIQTKDFTTGQGVVILRTSWTGTDTGLTYSNPFDPDNPHTGDPIFVNVEYGYTDFTNEYYSGGPDNFGAGGGFQDTAKVSFDNWHHLLISWDLDARRMWCALDDVNLTGHALPAWNDPSVGDNPNQSWSANEFAVRGKEGKSAHLSVSTIPTNPVNTPGPGRLNYVDSDLVQHSRDPVLHVELAELQIFPGIAADTDDVNVRRAFIDKNGKPVSPTKKATAQDRQSGSIEFFGVRPVVMLHFSGNWIKGKNTGSSGVDSKGTILPSGQFAPTGLIKKYKPDPSLYGKQGP